MGFARAGLAVREDGGFVSLEDVTGGEWVESSNVEEQIKCGKVSQGCSMQFREDTILYSEFGSRAPYNHANQNHPSS